MTKSIKEKTRQQKIREHVLNGSPVPAELLKIKISYDTKNFNKYSSLFRSSILVSPKNNNKIELTTDELALVQTVYNSNWLKNNLNHSLKEIILLKISDIANSLKIYNLHVNALFFIQKNNSKSRFFFSCILILFIQDYRKNIIGYLKFNDPSTNYDLTELIHKEKLKYIDFINNPKSIINSMFEHLKENESFMLFNTSYKFRNIKNCYLKTEIKKINKTVLDVSKYIKNINKFSFSIRINKNIRYSQVHYFSSTERIIWYLNIHSKCYELDIIRQFVELGELDIGVPEEDLVIENIDYIRSMIKLLKY